MRWVYSGIVALLIALLVLLALQNLESVTFAFLGFSVHAPLAIVIIGIYALGMLTGSGLMWLIRRSLAGARGHPQGMDH
ncbi:MAG: LapA family protein [Mesorhizobium sp.]|nr:LapA family protein [Mesorhizobium sp.]